MVSLAKVIGTQIYCWSWIMVSSANFICIYYCWLGSWCPRHTHCIYIAWIMVSSLFILVYLLLWLGSWCPRHIHFIQLAWIMVSSLLRLFIIMAWIMVSSSYTFYLVSLDHGVLATQAIYYYGLDHGVLVIYLLFIQLGSWCPRYLFYFIISRFGSWSPRRTIIIQFIIYFGPQSPGQFTQISCESYVFIRLQSRPLSLDYYYVFVIRYCVGCCVNVCLCFRVDYSRLLWITEDSLVIQFSN